MHRAVTFTACSHLDGCQPRQHTINQHSGAADGWQRTVDIDPHAVVNVSEAAELRQAQAGRQSDAAGATQITVSDGVSKGELLTCGVSGDGVAWRALQNGIDAAVAIELQCQARQTASGIKADGPIKADGELEHGTAAIAAIGRELDASDPGHVGHRRDIHRHRHRCARHQTGVSTVVAGQHRERRQTIAIDILIGCPERFGVGVDGVIAACRPGGCALGCDPQEQIAAGHGIHHIGRHFAIDVAGVGGSHQALVADLGSGVFQAAGNRGAQAGEAGGIVHRREGEGASGQGTGG